MNWVNVCLLLLLLMPQTLFSRTVDSDELLDPPTVTKPLTVDDGKAVMAVSCIVVGIPLVIVGALTTPKQDNDLYIACGSLCLVHASFCLIKF